MINLDTRLLKKLNGDELSVFCHILKRINKKNESFPSRSLIMKETGYGREKVAKALKGLKEKKVIEYFQKKTDGKFSKTHYKITTKLAGVFLCSDNEVLEVDCRDTDYRSTETTLTENPQLSINHNISINHNKDKTIKIDFTSLLDIINKTQNRTGASKFRLINKSVKSKFNARIKEGYTKENILLAIENVSKNDYHFKNKYQYATPEFFSRSTTLDKYGLTSVENKEINTEKPSEEITNPYKGMY